MKSRNRFLITPKIVVDLCFMLEFTIISFIIFFWIRQLRQSGQLGGNGDTFMPLFSADTLDFLITDVFLEERIKCTF